jgi:hypothetical protein
VILVEITVTEDNRNQSKSLGKEWILNIYLSIVLNSFYRTLSMGMENLSVQQPDDSQQQQQQQRSWSRW